MTEINVFKGMVLLKREIHELMVEDKTMSMTDINVFKGMVLLKREIEKLMMEDKAPLF